MSEAVLPAMSFPNRVIRPQPGTAFTADEFLDRQWLVTNGLGGYASASVAGVNSWHYHGLLVSSEAAPLGRMISLAQVLDSIVLPDGKTVCLSGEEQRADELDAPGAAFLTEFRLEAGLPVWIYTIGAIEIERRVVMAYRQNTVYLAYRLLRADGPVTLKLNPCISFRQYEATYDERNALRRYQVGFSGMRFEISAGTDLPVLRLYLQADTSCFSTEGEGRRDAFFRQDAARGIDARGLLRTVGQFTAEMRQGQSVVLTASTESWAGITALKPEESIILEQARRARLLTAAPEPLRQGFAAELVLAADAFIIQPAGRYREYIRSMATGEAVRAVIAGYHWFTDWGRDTMISLEGLMLVTGRFADARAILVAFERYIRGGLIPNMFPDGAEEGVYHTADATLWYFHALDRYLAYTGDTVTLRLLLPGLIAVAEAHIRGTCFGIGVAEDGLLQQGAEGYQLTWMDAKVDGWVVTPRRGKAVEINGLWYNALCLLTEWVEREQAPEQAEPWRAQAAKMRAAFNARFWNEAGACLFDIVDGEHGDDTACRPNQLLAISLRHPVLDAARWPAVVATVQKKLLTPLGLRTLSSDHPDYKPCYSGDLRSRDAAYHQGTVWPWLIGPFIDAWLKVHPGSQHEARRFLAGFEAHMNEAGIGSINEICDAEAPYAPRGCIAQAWSIAEVLRCWSKTEPGAAV